MSFSWYIRAGVSHQNSLLLCFTFSFRYNAKLTYRTFSLALFGCFYCCCLNTGHGKACVSVCPSNFSTSIRICMGCIDVKPSAARGARILRSCEHDKLNKNCLHMDRYVFLINLSTCSKTCSIVAREVVYSSVIYCLRRSVIILECIPIIVKVLFQCRNLNKVAFLWQFIQE